MIIDNQKGYQKCWKLSNDYNQPFKNKSNLEIKKKKHEKLTSR